MKKQQLFFILHNPQIDSKSNYLCFLVESLKYHYDNMLCSCSSAHLLKTHDTWMPLKSRSLFELLTPHYSSTIPAGLYQYIDSVFGKVDTFVS
ncbi:hypothetical protein ES705_05993 [subsurface metagenome]